jgi:hypothetical protein
MLSAEGSYAQMAASRMRSFCSDVESGYRTFTDRKTHWCYLSDYANHFEQQHRERLQEIDKHFLAASTRKYKVFGKEVTSDTLCEQFRTDIPKLEQGYTHYAN